MEWQGPGSPLLHLRARTAGPEWITHPEPHRGQLQFRRWPGSRSTGHGTLSENRQPHLTRPAACDPELVAETTIDLTRSRPTTLYYLRCGSTSTRSTMGNLDLYTDGKRVRVACRLKDPLMWMSVARRWHSPCPGARSKLTVARHQRRQPLPFSLCLRPMATSPSWPTQSCTLVSTEVAGRLHRCHRRHVCRGRQGRNSQAIA
jgi:hypothetical protein